jgi:hypothetical protein
MKLFEIMRLFFRLVRLLFVARLFSVSVESGLGLDGDIFLGIFELEVLAGSMAFEDAGGAVSSEGLIANRKDGLECGLDESLDGGLPVSIIGKRSFI